MINAYHTLLRVLDQLRSEAPREFTSYHPDPSDVESLNAARAKAFVHLLLKVYFGLTTFNERVALITDGSDDGGVDAYFIDSGRKTIYFVQSKFRTTERNFEGKSLDAEELLSMDIDRILNGDDESAAGQRYNNKILRMAATVRAIEDIGRYSYKVIILANAKGVTRTKLTTLTGGFPAELMDYQRCYERLLFPLVSGTYYNAEELHLSLTLSNKNAGAKISYSVVTEFAGCEITVVFVPTLEVAKAMHKYRNSILRYNPRSYLEHEGHNVNAEIRRSIESRATNEFALFNNGITLVSDETYLNERIGQKDRAQLTLVDPQIINGGQTAYTLSLIYRENLEGDLDAIFGQKEVLVKIITFDRSGGLTDAQQLTLIEDISRATNQQTIVTKADRRSNEPALQELQKRAFDELGVLLEWKRGEFADGIREGYLSEDDVVERSTFLKVAYAVQGKVKIAAQKRLAAKCDYRELLDVTPEVFRRYAAGVSLFRALVDSSRKRLAQNLSLLARVYIASELTVARFPDAPATPSDLEAIAEEVARRADSFLLWARQSTSVDTLSLHGAES